MIIVLKPNQKQEVVNEFIEKLTNAYDCLLYTSNSWSARSSEGEGKIDAGVKVRIEQIVGLTLLVTPVPLGSEEKEEVNNAN